MNTEYTFTKPGSSIQFGCMIGEPIEEARKYARQLRLPVVEIREAGRVIEVVTNRK